MNKKIDYSSIEDMDLDFDEESNSMIYTVTMINGHKHVYTLKEISSPDRDNVHDMHLVLTAAELDNMINECQDDYEI